MKRASPQTSATYSRIALAAEICAGPHNRLLRRQHCSSLCSQSEGHEHVANMASALGMTFLIFQSMFGRHNIRSPHFASKVSYSASPQTSAECSRNAPCSGRSEKRTLPVFLKSITNNRGNIKLSYSQSKSVLKLSNNSLFIFFGFPSIQFCCFQCVLPVRSLSTRQGVFSPCGR